MDSPSIDVAFAVWAAVVGLVGAAIVYELVRLRAELASINRQLNDYIVGMERRVTALETHFGISQTGSFNAPQFGVANFSRGDKGTL